MSILSGAHNHVCPRITALLAEHDLDDVLVVVGGIIPDTDIPRLKEAGVAGVFQPGTPMQAIIDFHPRARSPRLLTPLRASRYSRPFMGYKLLLAEDSAAIQQVVQLAVQRRGTSMSWSSMTATPRLLRFERESPDIVLADASLPGTNGYDLAGPHRRA